MTWWWQDCPWTFAIPHATRVALSSTTTFRAAATLRLAARNPGNSDHTLATTAPESVFTGEFARFRTVTLPNYLRMDGWRDDVVVMMRIWDMNMMTTLPLDVRLYFGSFPTKLPLNKTQHKTQSTTQITQHNTNHNTRTQHKTQHTKHKTQSTIQITAQEHNTKQNTTQNTTQNTKHNTQHKAQHKVHNTKYTKYTKHNTTPHHTKLRYAKSDKNSST